MTLLELLVVFIVVVAGAMLARTFFRSEAEQREIWEKAAEDQNALLDKALRDKDIAAYRMMLDPEVTRFLPQLPYRTDGSKSVGDLVENQLGAAEIPPESVYTKNVQTYRHCILITYTFMMKGKKDDKPVDYTGKTTRFWTRSKGGRWYLVHEHTSFNG